MTLAVFSAQVPRISICAIAIFMTGSRQAGDQQVQVGMHPVRSHSKMHDTPQVYQL